MNTKRRKSLEKIFKKPIPSDVRWSEIESLLVHLGAEVSPGSGSRVCVTLDGVRAVFHKPHPGPNTDKACVVMVRDFLKATGVNYHDEI